MQYTVKCNNALLACTLLSNPARDRKGVMLLVCNGQTFGWAMPADKFDDGPKRRMEEA